MVTFPCRSRAVGSLFSDRISIIFIIKNGVTFRMVALFIEKELEFQ